MAGRLPPPEHTRAPLPSYHLFGRDRDGDSSDQTTTYCALKTIDANSVNRLFFSKLNVDALQEAIRYKVYVQTDGRHVISRQSPEELHSVMNGMYLTYGKNMLEPDRALRDVQSLNQRVLDYCVRHIVGELEMYERYRRDIETYPNPLERAALETSKGTKVLEFKTFM